MVDVDAVRAGPLGGWVDARLVPKVLVAGQGRVIEAVVDERGEWLPSVPVLSVVPHDPTDLWRILAVLLAPPVVAHAAARYLGTGLTPGSVKVSAQQLAALPLPADESAWAERADLARRGQGRPRSDRHDGGLRRQRRRARSGGSAAPRSPMRPRRRPVTYLS